MQTSPVGSITFLAATTAIVIVVVAVTIVTERISLGSCLMHDGPT